jgi:large subunit ribosomal protein L30
MTRKTKAAAGGAKVRIRQIKSGIGYKANQKATLEALGLGKMNRVRIHPDNPEIRAMAAAIPHLVSIEPVEGDGSK